MRFGSGVDARFVEGNIQPRREFTAKLQVVIGLRSTQPMMQVGGMEHETQSAALVCECAQQSN
jgi:hypothetical protein